MLVGGAACPPALMTGFEERYGVRVIAAWGMTETSPLGTVARPPQYARTRYRAGELTVTLLGD